jgi:hypothetical protein
VCCTTVRQCFNVFRCAPDATSEAQVSASHWSSKDLTLLDRGLLGAILVVSVSRIARAANCRKSRSLNLHTHRNDAWNVCCEVFRPAALRCLRGVVMASISTLCASNLFASLPVELLSLMRTPRHLQRHTRTGTYRCDSIDISDLLIICCTAYGLERLVLSLRFDVFSSLGSWLHGLRTRIFGTFVAVLRSLAGYLNHHR